MFRDLDAGLLHAAIFWGFVILTVGTFDRVTFGLVEKIVRPLLDGWLWRLLVLGQNVFILTVLAAVAYALFRRLVWRYPRRTTLSRDGVVILLLIGGVVLTEWLTEAFRLACVWRSGRSVGDRGLPAQPAARAPSCRIHGCPSATGFSSGRTSRWSASSSSTCRAPSTCTSSPRSSTPRCASSSHAASCPRSTWRRRTPNAQFGIKTIDDMSWKDLLDGFTCTECGRCQEACPAWATGKPLNPKTMIMGIREMAVDSEHGMPLIPWIKPSVAPGGQATPVVDTAIPYDAVWDCVTCGACVEACPVMIEHVDKIVGLRRNLVLEESRFPEELASSFNNMERYQNIWGQSQASRLDWARGLPFEVPTAASVVESGRAGRRRGAGVPVLGRLRRFVRRPQSARRARGRHVPGSGGSALRRAGPGGVVHRRPGPSDGQRLRLPDARRRQRRHAEPVQAQDDHHRLSALLQHDRQ